MPPLLLLSLANLVLLSYKVNQMSGDQMVLTMKIMTQDMIILELELVIQPKLPPAPPNAELETGFPFIIKQNYLEISEK